MGRKDRVSSLESDLEESLLKAGFKTVQIKELDLVTDQVFFCGVKNEIQKLFISRLMKIKCPGIHPGFYKG